jgi:23S rRNA (cytidine1920-2'-O)/16S rRNA (cytidine1409-2'-O)-methyltransferase
MRHEAANFVGRGGLKLAAALSAFALDVRGCVCADFGCNVGGFTDCLLRAGAAKVHALDTGYGQLAWKLRKDPRVVVRERTNVLHCPADEPVDLVAIDLAWTPQELGVPAAMRWLKPGGRIVSLLKPHYELAHVLGRRPDRTLDLKDAREIVRKVCARLHAAGATVLAIAPSPIEGKGGNEEFLLLIAQSPPGQE